MYSYSASTNRFYLDESKEVFKKSNLWPEDAKAITFRTYAKFVMLNPPKDMIMIAGDDGYPRWAESNHLPKSCYIKEAEHLKRHYVSTAILAIRRLLKERKLRTLTEDQYYLLDKWKLYLMELHYLDLSKAPDITWPEIPGAE